MAANWTIKGGNVTKTTVSVYGIFELAEQFEQIKLDILKAANDASHEAMKPALAYVKSTTDFKDKTGRLRKALRIFNISEPKRGKSRVWVSIGVPYGLGLQYYIPLEMGHKVLRGKKGSFSKNSKTDYDKRNTGSRVPAANYLYHAYKMIEPNANQKITDAVNRVLEKYKPEATRYYNR
jgi:hypothetical protein